MTRDVGHGSTLRARLETAALVAVLTVAVLCSMALAAAIVYAVLAL